MIGPNLRAASLFSQYDMGLTTRKVVRTIAGLARFDFVPGSLPHFGKEAATKVKPLAGGRKLDCYSPFLSHAQRVAEGDWNYPAPTPRSKASWSRW
jgi:hypothetical protein